MRIRLARGSRSGWWEPGDGLGEDDAASGEPATGAKDVASERTGLRGTGRKEDDGEGDGEDGIDDERTEGDGWELSTGWVVSRGVWRRFDGVDSVGRLIRLWIRFVLRA